MKVLSSRRFPGPAWDDLRDVEYADGSIAATVKEARADVDVLAVVAERVDAALLELVPRVRLVANYGVGYDLIDVDACARRGIIVTNTPGVLDAATADLALALLLAVRRRVVEADRFVRSGRWATDWAQTDLRSREVTGMCLGIVGLGRIGRAVARRAGGFEMTLLYSQRRRLPIDEEEELGVAFRPLDELVQEADAVTLHIPLSPETQQLFDRSRLALLRDGACLVNTARGAIVDERALVDELRSGRISAGLDVFAHEPHVPQELFELPNVVLTPHVGTATAETRAAMTRVMVDNILAVADGREPPNRVYPVGAAP